MPIHASTEARRGCGFRKPGGLYLVGGPVTEPCGRLPIPLDVCRTCGAGISHSRGWKWIEPEKLFGFEYGFKPCREDGAAICAGCPLGLRLPERAGLLWVGKQFYPTPQEFTTEAAMLGISRRIKAVPKGFVAGETWIYLAHVRAVTVWEPSNQEPHLGRIAAPDTVLRPGIFTAFRPTRVEYVVKRDDTAEKLESLEQRGIRLVEVTHAAEPEPLPFVEAEPEEPGEEAL